MPIYEYRCRDCRKRTQVLTLSVGAAVEARCRHCGGTNLEKLVSRVAFLRSEESRLESLADPSNLTGLDENDPKSVARWMKKMGREMGEDMDGDFEQEVERASEEAGGGEAGDDPAAGGAGTGSDDDF
jgi:putative FmdB family regulatory protein